MTENEAIELLRSMQNPKQDYADIVCAPAFCTGFRFVYPEPEDYAIEEAIKALKEIQLYKDNKLCLIPEDVYSRQCSELDTYKEIGTVEECREAVEKQAAERINYETNAVFNNGFGYYRIGKCPICNSCYNSNDEIKYCSRCGKKLDWSKENE